MYNEEKPKKKRFKLFDTQREGKGVSKEEADKIAEDLKAAGAEVEVK